MSKTTIDKTPEQSALASAQCSVIPREHLVEMLKCAVWYSGGRECYGEHQGYSFDVDEETSLRDVLYRDEPLYKTPEEAIVAHWQRHYCRTWALRRVLPNQTRTKGNNMTNDSEKLDGVITSPPATFSARRRFRIVTDKYNGYGVQEKVWWWPWWKQPCTNTSCSVEQAERWLETYLKRKVTYHKHKVVKYL